MSRLPPVMGRSKSELISLQTVSYTVDTLTHCESLGFQKKSKSIKFSSLNVRHISDEHIFAVYATDFNAHERYTDLYQHAYQ